MDGIHLAEGEDQWWALVNMVMNFQVPEKAGNFLTRRGTISFSKRTLLHLVSFSWNIKILYTATIETGSEAQTASSLLGTRGSLSGSKATGLWSWPLPSGNKDSFTSTPSTPSWCSALV
jgi:hypothetical protein